MKVEADKILHMVGGLGETSYAANSTLQEKAIQIAKPIVQESVSNVEHTLQPETFITCDLGCSSGPTTFMVITEIMDSVHETCYQMSYKHPEIMFFLNDLPGNDFNTIFKSLTTFEKNVRAKKGDQDVPLFYVFGAPGSFYRSLFPKESVHFMHSSYSLHWLSQVPYGLEDDSGVAINKRNIYISKTSPPHVYQAYSAEFQQGFTKFLELRSKEIVCGGQMALTFLGRSSQNPLSGEINYLLGLLADALNSLVQEGIIEEEKVDTFNLPVYAPSIEEVKAVVTSEGSFEFYQLQTFELNWDPFDDNKDDFVADSFASGKNTAKNIRAVLEPMLASHFGEAIMDEVFSRYSMNVAQHLKSQKTKYINLVMALKKRGR